MTDTRTPGRSCVLLLSGGLDSTTLLAQASNDGWRVHALTVQYGQRHAHEIAAARRAAARWGVAQHIVTQIDLRAFGGSALTADIPVPKDRPEVSPGSGSLASGEANPAASIPVTYVPARNTVFLSLALAWAEVVGAFDLFIGVNALDYSGYPDCRPEYIRAFEALANLATKAGVEGAGQFRVHTPLIALSKREIIEIGTRLGVDLAATISCYDPADDGRACGACDACRLRQKGFAEARLADSTRYASTNS